MNRALILLIYFSFFLVPSAGPFSQSTADITKKNSEKERIKLSRIKSKAVWEYRYSSQADVLGDSGFKSYYYSYDDNGRLTEYKKYHVSPELSTKEIYTYGKTGNIIRTDRYNSAENKIETIEYKYNSAGKLKNQIHSEYLNMIQPGVYFTIQADAEGEELFARLQDELQIEPRLAGYTITVNITDSEELNQYIVIGDESDPTSPRYSFSQLSLGSQKELLEYRGPNRKEHKFFSKHVATVTYKYDKAGNLKEKSVFNTSNDLIERESFHYNSDNLKTNYYKYNENDKITSRETYTYDAKWNLTETAGLEPDGKITSKLLYEYDNNHNLVKKRWVNSSGEVNGEFRYSYDNNLRLKEETKLSGTGEKESALAYNYDENGNLLEITKYDINNKKEKLVRYIYDFY